jgi:hypothetical protein
MTELRLQTEFMEEWGLLVPAGGDRAQNRAVKPDGTIVRPIFVSTQHGFMALVSPFAKFEGNVVVAHKDGTPGAQQTIYDLDRVRRRQLHEVADVVGEVILSRMCADSATRRPIEHVEGFALPDHAHIVLLAAVRGEGRNLYERMRNEWSEAGALDAVQESLRFSDDEARMLDSELSAIARI